MPFRSTYAGRVQAPTHLGAQLYVRFDPAGVVQESADIALRRDVRERLRIGAVQHVGDGGGMQVVADGAQGQERTSDELAGGRRVSHLRSPFHLSIPPVSLLPIFRMRSLNGRRTGLRTIAAGAVGVQHDIHRASPHHGLAFFCH